MHSFGRGGVCLVLAVCAVLAFVCTHGAYSAAEKKEAKSNELCYVCHFDMITEDITNIHLKRKIVCTDCHGISKHHMHDEMLMTKPDKLFGRSEVVGLCKHCHGGDLHKGKEAKLEAFRKEWLGKDRPNGRAINAESICTDCHGTHNIVKEMKGAASDEQGEWTPLFNGEDLDDWTKSGEAAWAIKRGRIVATVGAGGKGGMLWAKGVHNDFMASVTFKVDGAASAGLWLRGDGKGGGARVEILGAARSGVHTGSVSVPRVGIVLANVDKELVSEMMWNTVSVKMAGKRLTVWLNGEEIGSVRLTGAEKGRIGLYVADSDGKGELTIGEVQVQAVE